MKTWILFLLLMLLPFSAAAQKTVLLPVTYTIYKSNSPSAERASRVADAMRAGVEEAGAEIVDLNEDFQACAHVECLRATAKKQGTDNAIFISVVDKDGEFEITVISAVGETAKATPFGTFGSLIARVKGIVRQIMEDTAKEVAPTPVVEEPEVELEEPVSKDNEVVEPPEKTPETPQEDTSTPLVQEDDGGLAPVGFFVMAGLTSALAITYGIVDGVGYAKYNDGEDDLEGLQTADRVLLGVTLAGAVTTAILFFLTDFDSDDTSEKASAKLKRPTLSPVATENGGMLMVEGRF
jgi:hypothetical protein